MELEGLVPRVFLESATPAMASFNKRSKWNVHWNDVAAGQRLTPCPPLVGVTPVNRISSFTKIPRVDNLKSRC
jgi:hypothetical protein